MKKQICVDRPTFQRILTDAQKFVLVENHFETSIGEEVEILEIELIDEEHEPTGNKISVFVTCYLPNLPELQPTWGIIGFNLYASKLG